MHAQTLRNASCNIGLQKGWSALLSMQTISISTAGLAQDSCTRWERMVDLKSGLPTEAKLSRVLAPTARWGAGQGATQAARAEG